MVSNISGDRAATSDAFIQLSAARWARLWAVIQQDDRSSPTPWTADEARAVVLAILYRALTGVAWTNLPAWAPPAKLVRASYRRWQQHGLLARLGAELLIRLDEPPTARSR